MADQGMGWNHDPQGLAHGSRSSGCLQ